MFGKDIVGNYNDNERGYLQGHVEANAEWVRQLTYALPEMVLEVYSPATVAQYLKELRIKIS
jgi:hypothetical protein